MSLLLAILAVFFVWETVLSVSPWTIPGWIQPALVFGGSLAYVWPDWRLALAVSGAVGLLHVLAVTRERHTGRRVQAVERTGRRSRLPNLP